MTSHDDLDPGLEERARTLLTAAAETVPAPSGPLLSGHRRPVWPWLVAAAAVAVVVVGLPVLLGVPDDQQPVPTPTPGGDVTVPQTLWMTDGQATEVLEVAGLEVDTMRDDTCKVPRGRVSGSEPVGGIAVRPGATVRVRVAQPPPTAYCAYPRSQQDAAGLLDLARFGVSHLGFAPSVGIYVDGEQTMSLAAEDAADPAAWGDPSPLTALREAVDAVDLVNGKPASPAVMTLSDRGGQYACGPTDPPAPLKDRPSTVISVETPTDGIFGCQWIRVYRDEGGLIDAVTLSSTALPGEPPDEAEDPAEPSEVSREKRAVAQTFVAYARGGEPPAFATDVEVLLGNRVFASANDVAAGPRGMWSVRCQPGYAERSCPIDVLEVVGGEARPAVTSTVMRDHSACHTVFGELPSELSDPEALRRSVSLSVPEPASCIDAWELQLWLDDQDRIYAANLILGSP